MPFERPPSANLFCTRVKLAVLCLGLLAANTATQTARAATTTSVRPREQQNAQLSRDMASPKTTTPVIGVLTEVLRDYLRFTNTHHLFIAASYVKWLESAGAQVVPILLNQNDSYYETMFKQTNGLLFPGGDNLLDPNRDTPMMVAARKMYKLAKESNDKGDFYPIWGTCLGLELLSVLSSGRNVLEDCSASDLSLPLQFETRGKMFAPSCYSNICSLNKDFSQLVVELLKSEGLTYNYHHKCLTDEGIKRANLDNFYRPLAYSFDKNNKKFVAIFEAIDYPFYGVQFHPEKAPFEFVVRRDQQKVPHSREAIAISRYFADFFVSQAQLSGHAETLPRKLQNKFIYATEPLYTAPKNDMYEQRYLFPFGQETGVDTAEFVEHVPSDGEDIPEDFVELESQDENVIQLGNIKFKLASRESIEEDLLSY